MITWNKELYHSWGKSPKQKAREKSYNHQYYLKNKEKWKNNTRSMPDNVFAGDWPARIKAEKAAIDAEYEALGRPLTEAEKKERDRKKAELDQEYQIGISSGAYQQIGLTSRPRPRKKYVTHLTPRAREKYSAKPMDRALGAETTGQAKDNARKKVQEKTEQIKEDLIYKPRKKRKETARRVSAVSNRMSREERFRRAKKRRTEGWYI